MHAKDAKPAQNNTCSRILQEVMGKPIEMHIVEGLRVAKTIENANKIDIPGVIFKDNIVKRKKNLKTH